MESPVASLNEKRQQPPGAGIQVRNLYFMYHMVYIENFNIITV
jgi:hypothetical protein